MKVIKKKLTMHDLWIACYVAFRQWKSHNIESGVCEWKYADGIPKNSTTRLATFALLLLTILSTIPNTESCELCSQWNRSADQDMPNFPPVPKYCESGRIPSTWDSIQATNNSKLIYFFWVLLLWRQMLFGFCKLFVQTLFHQ